MSKPLTPKDTAASILTRAANIKIVGEEVVDLIRDAEASMRAAPIPANGLARYSITNRVYVPSKTLSTVEIVGDPILTLAQVAGAARKREGGGKELLIAGIRPDVDYAYALCQMVDTAVVEAWNVHSKEEAVQALPVAARLTYRRTYQRGMCVTIREKITQMNADRLMAMKAEDRKTLARKRELVAGAVQ